MTSSTSPPPPPSSSDRWRRWRLNALFTLWGGMALTPWMMFAVAHDFYMFKLRNATLYTPDNWRSLPIDEKYGDKRELTTLQKTYESVFVLTFSALGIPMAAYVAVVSRPVTRMLIGQTLCMSGIFVAIVLALVDSDTWQTLFLVLSLIMPAIANFGGVALCLGTVVGIATDMGDKVPAGVSYVNIGQAGVGTLYALTSLIVKATTPGEQTAGIIYFSFGASIVTASLVFYVVAYKREWLTGKGEVSVKIERSQWETIAHVWRVIVALRYEGLLTIASFAVTFCIYPGLSVLIVSSSGNDIWTKYFKDIATFLLHNVVNLLGRIAYLKLGWPKMGSIASIFLLIPRILIAMLIFTCLMSESERKYSVTFIHSDAVYMILCALHAFGHGYMHSLLVVHGARRHPDAHTSGIITSLNSGIGLLLGAIINIMILKFLL